MPEEKTFKPEGLEGNYTQMCRPCTVCAGLNPTAFEIKTCSAFTDAVCKGCDPCPPGLTRVGCAGSWEGRCELLDNIGKVRRAHAFAKRLHARVKALPCLVVATVSVRACCLSLSLSLSLSL